MEMLNESRNDGLTNPIPPNMELSDDQNEMRMRRSKSRGSPPRPSSSDFNRANMMGIDSNIRNRFENVQRTSLERINNQSNQQIEANNLNEMGYSGLHQSIVQTVKVAGTQPLFGMPRKE